MNMKKSLLVLCLWMTGLTAMAQKSFVLVRTTTSYIHLGGDVPGDMQGTYTIRQSGREHVEGIADVLNQLSKHGLELEQVTPVGDGHLTYLFSKMSSGPANAITRIAVDDGEEAYEVARYNLQGVPVNKNEKGIQIIVYSNYTTKTIIVE